MWQVRWKNSCAMLRLTGRRRRYVGPSSMSSCLTIRSSRLRLKLCWALAAADLIALATSRVACLGENSRYARASVTFMPLTESATRRALRGARRTYLGTAEPSIVAIYYFNAVAFSVWVPWPRKCLVGANSPSRWPTMFSLMNTGTCLRPSWTPMVWPTMSGYMTDARAQVRITFFSRVRFNLSILAFSGALMNGPFLVDLLIYFWRPFFSLRRMISLFEAFFGLRVR